MLEVKMQAQPSPWTGQERFLLGEVEKLIVVTPYLKTSEPVAIRGVTFHPLQRAKRSRSKDAKAVRAVASLFFLRDNLQITDMAYAVIDVQSEEHNYALIDEQLDTIELVLAYVYTSPGRRPREPFLTAEHATLFRFVPSRISGWMLAGPGAPLVRPLRGTSVPSAESTHDGFEAWTSRREYLYLVADSRIYPPARDFGLNYSQDLYVDLRQANWPRASDRLPVLYSACRALAPDLEERLLRAMRWYSKSASCFCKAEESLLNLAIAFEALLQLGWTDKSQELCRRIQLLTGPAPRLDSWTTQFYEARSAVVHEGTASSTEFLAVDATKLKAAQIGKIPAARYRSLTDYGRLIFRECIRAVLWGGAGAFELKLHRLFFHNQERLEAICKSLQLANTDEADALQAISELVDGLDEAWWESEEITSIETVFAAGALLAARCERESPLCDDEELQQILVELKGHAKARAMVDTVKGWDRLAKVLEVRFNAGVPFVASELSTPTTWKEVLMAFARFAGTASMSLKAWAVDASCP
jgi:hypothetical protein